MKVFNTNFHASRESSYDVLTGFYSFAVTVPSPVVSEVGETDTRFLVVAYMSVPFPT